MPTFKFHGQVTVSAYFEVEADTQEEAQEAAEAAADSPTITREDEEGEWCITDADGMVVDIEPA
jgi:ribosomal silencing factor RsfS